MMKNNWLKCSVCSSYRVNYAFTLDKNRFVKCGECSLIAIYPQPSDEILNNIYGPNYFLLSKSQEGLKHTHFLKQKTAEKVIDYLEKYLALLGEDIKNKKLLEIGSGMGDFLKVSKERLLSVTGIEYSQDAVDSIIKYMGGSCKVRNGEIFNHPDDEKYDLIVFNDVLEHVRDPAKFLDKVFTLLKDRGVVLCTVPTLDSWSAKMQGTNWIEFKTEHLFYFNNSNLRRLFYKHGFTNIFEKEAKKTLSIKYIAEHFQMNQRRFWTPFFRLVSMLLPSSLLIRPINIVASGTVLIAQKETPKQDLVLTVIMAVYNEKNTVNEVINTLLKKQIRDCEIKLIVVESNSTDGSREIVESFKEHPRVKIIYQDKPRGKGNAIREGLKIADGDIVLIQDADLEYDIEDYDGLIELMRSGEHMFLLGSRHGGEKWKIRHFEGQPIVAFLVNMVHWILTSMINIFYGVRLRDPFTMFKVFRRSAILDLTFEANRFDFDYELLLKLIRRGYTPIEVPVNYVARSFRQGKKVRFFRDPITWVWAIIKYRFCRI
jgi:2-polyprenyl-3-methyl-5-hydroxy-6-metoxy-1,4-benzoquinol methylase